MMCKSKSKRRKRKSDMKCECESVNGQFPTFLEMPPPSGPPDYSKSFADCYNQNNDADEADE